MFTAFGSRTPDGGDLPGYMKRHNDAARELADSDFDTCVVQDATATPLKASHDAALSILATFSAIVSVADVLDP